MSEMALPALATGSAADRQARIFIICIIGASILPIVLYWLASASPSGATVFAANTAWLFGSAHVALTGFLWFDTRYRQHIQERPLYFYGLPATVSVVWLMGVGLGGEIGLVTSQAVFHVWLLHHFGRQNWGVLCLAAAGTKCGPASAMERRICTWAPVFAATGIPDVSTAFAWTGAESLIQWAGFGLSVLMAGAFLILAARHAYAGAPALRVAMTVLVGLFFLPIYVIPSGHHAVGTAHAFQYALIIGYIAAAKHASPKLWTLPLVALSVIYVGLFVLLRAAEAEGTLFLLWQMVVVWHFLIDADVWRLSRPFQRQAIRESLPFLFRTPRSG